MLQLPTTIAQAVFSTSPGPAAKPFEQGTIPPQVSVDVLVDPLMASQPGTTDNLLRAEIMNQKDFDLCDAFQADAPAKAGTYAAPSHQSMHSFWLTAAAAAIATKFAADHAGRARRVQGNGSDAPPGFEQGMNKVYFMQAQAV